MRNLKQLRLSPATNIQALSAKARRAAALSIVERKLYGPSRATQQKRAQKGPRISPIQLSERSIRAHIAAHAGDGTTLVTEAPARYSSAHAIICLYNNADIEAQRIAQKLRKTDPTIKIPKLRPIIRYVLYPSVLEPTQLGSVAIYCENARHLHATICETGHLFGIPVKRSTLEVGMSQYIDVVFRA